MADLQVLIRVSWVLGATLAALAGAEVQRDTVPLADGGTTPRLTLATDEVRVAVLPELGGKIVSLTDRAGGEFLSRSRKPYALRKSGKAYGDSEFDGIDECFPTVGACTYPAAPWSGVELPEHGDLWSQAWTVVPSDRHDAIILEAHGTALPYRFRRGITVAGATVTLDYTVSNDGDAPLPYLYTFHPLFRGRKTAAAWNGPPHKR